MKKKLFIFKKAYTMNFPSEYKKAVLVSGDKIEALLDARETSLFMDAQGAKTEIFDFSHLYCLPGFFDSHTHFMQTGYNASVIKLNEASSIEGIKDAIASSIKNNTAADNKGIVMSHGFDESSFPEGRTPDKDDLDAVSKSTPIYAGRVDHHSAVVNSAFLKLFETFLKNNGADKRAFETGILRQRPNYALKSELIRLFPEKKRMEAFRKAELIALKAGITSLCALEGGAISDESDVNFVNGMTESAKNLVNIILFRQDTDFSKASRMGLGRIGGCLLVDGSFGSSTAALKAPYHKSKNNRGILYFKKEDLYSFMENAHAHNLQMAFHAIGDAAIEMMLDCYEALLKKAASAASNDMRHRIEHFELASPRDIKRAADLGIVLSMQPVFETLWGGESAMYAERLGKKRALQTNRFASILKSGCVIAGGSDSDVTPMSPVNGIHALLNLPNESERISAWDAVSIFTRNGAFANFKERERGSLAPGKYADMTVCDADIFDSKKETVKNIRIAATIVKGMQAYKNEKIKGRR